LGGDNYNLQCELSFTFHCSPVNTYYEVSCDTTHFGRQAPITEVHGITANKTMSW